MKAGSARTHFRRGLQNIELLLTRRFRTIPYTKKTAALKGSLQRCTRMNVRALTKTDSLVFPALLCRLPHSLVRKDRRNMEKSIKKYWPLFLLPTLAAFAIGFIFPFLWGIFLSFHKFTTISKTTFVGLDNYIKVSRTARSPLLSGSPRNLPSFRPSSSTSSPLPLRLR